MDELSSERQDESLGGEELRADGAVLAPSSSTIQPLICGVNGPLVETFLELIRDNYKKADKATFFLEQRTGIVNVQGITNVRDVLSHLVTLLNADTPDDKRLEQLGNAEEHLRRAIIEPYEVALNELTVRFAKLYDSYKERVLPIKDRHASLAGAPNTISIEATLRDIRELTSRGRTGKGKNLWNPEWEQGVAGFIEAFEKLFTLHAELESYYNRFGQIERDDANAREIATLREDLNSQSRKSTVLSIWSITATIVTFVLAIIITILITK